MTEIHLTDEQEAELYRLLGLRRIAGRCRPACERSCWWPRSAPTLASTAGCGLVTASWRRVTWRRCVRRSPSSRPPGCDRATGRRCGHASATGRPETCPAAVTRRQSHPRQGSARIDDGPGGAKASNWGVTLSPPLLSWPAPQPGRAARDSLRAGPPRASCKPQLDTGWPLPLRADSPQRTARPWFRPTRN